jgi:hypothetical protein
MHKQENGIDYFNCGSWIDAHPTYIAIDEEGVRIHEYADEAAGHGRGELRTDHVRDRSAVASNHPEDDGESELFGVDEYEDVRG